MNFPINSNVRNNITEIRTTFQQINRILATLLPAEYLRLDASNDPLTAELKSQNILPNIDDTYNLGSPTFKWSEIHGGFVSAFLFMKRIINRNLTVPADQSFVLSDAVIQNGFEIDVNDGAEIIMI